MFLAVDVTKPLESVGEKFAYGGQMLLIGMSVVFSVLLLLWGALELFHVVVTKIPAAIEKKREKKVEPAPAQEIAVTGNEDDEEIVAVIAAAIAAASEENPAGSFRVVSFRRV
ncbi:MAG: OadG family protein [Clostridia bacterium]|nr:OadG family protein [Clostridia bacterium]